MKKISLFFAFVCILMTGIFAQNQVLTVGNNGNNMNQTVLTLSNENQTTIRFDLNEVELFAVETGHAPSLPTGYGQAFIPASDNAPLMMEEGAPELFYLTTSFVVPDKGGSELEISYGQYQDFENIEIAPSKGNLSRQIDPATVPFVKGEVYNQNAFFPGTLANLREPFIMRDVRGQSVDVYPVQYNPVTKVLRIYSEITVTVTNTQQHGINEFTNQKRHQTVDPAFNQIYNSLFINYSTLNRDYPTGEDGELLVICHPAFMDDMLPYINWKNTIGRKTTMVSTAETTTTVAGIKTYITNYYNNNNLAYVLLVGDLAQIPTYTYTTPGNPPETCYSDIYYAQIVSSVYLDILIGRMSAENVAQVQTQVQRTIWYERDLTTADDWLSKAVGLAANEGPGHSGEYDYQHMNNIRNKLMTYGYDPVYQEYSYNCPGITNTTTAQISSRFNEGMGVANYCNHGDIDGWYLNNGSNYITFKNANVNALQNAGKLPYVFSVACLNGKFSGTCFAEAWMRATQNGQPTGAIATMMGSISLSWQPPMTAQDEFVHICLDLPPYQGQAAGIKRTFAGAALNASQKMRIVHNTSANHDYNSWCVFGDPTLQFRTKTPEEMTVSYLPLVPLGAESFTVECDADGATAAISYIDENEEVVLLGAGVVTDGVAEIVFDEPLSYIGELTLAVTGFNKVTFIDNELMVGGEIIMNEPLNLTCTVENVSHVLVNWSEPQGSTIPVKGYNVYRNDELITFEPVRDEVTFTDIVSKNGEYTYTVTALYNNSGSLESEPSAPKTVTIDGMCVAIERVVVQDNDESSILVSWETPNYEGIDLAGYNVYRDNEKLNEELIPATELSYLDENLEFGTQYCYQVEVVYNDCEETLITEENCQILSIRDISGEQFSIYPNPAHGEVNIKGDVIPVSVKLFNIQGQMIFETTQCDTNMKISVASLSTGLYFIKIDTEKGTIMKKIAVD